MTSDSQDTSTNTLDWHYLSSLCICIQLINKGLYDRNRVNQDDSFLNLSTLIILATYIL